MKPLADDQNRKGKEKELITGLSFKKLEDGEVISNRMNERPIQMELQ